MAGSIARSAKQVVQAERAKTAGVPSRLVPLLSVPLLLGLWWLATLLMPPYLLPSPSRVLYALREISVSGELAAQLQLTFTHVLAGAALSVVLGSILGIVLALSPLTARLFGSWVPLLQATPGLVWALIAIVWFGLNPVGVVFVICLGTLPTILIGVWEAIRNVDRLLLDMARAFGASGWQRLSRIYLPAVTPHLLAGTRIAVGLGWKVAVVAEMFMSGHGVGSALYTAAFAMRMDLLLAWTAVLVSCMLLLEYLVFRPLERRVTRWRPS
jgi:NitT/TauT family transport system permease protein